MCGDWMIDLSVNKKCFSSAIYFLILSKPCLTSSSREQRKTPENTLTTLTTPITRVASHCTNTTSTPPPCTCT